MFAFRVWPRPLAISTGILLAALMLFTSCGGVDSGGTGAYGAGPVSGFGSVIVNGVRFDASRAEVLDDDNQAQSAAALKLGMMTMIDAGTLTPASGGTPARASATTIRYGSDLIGPIDTVDAAGGSFTVLGQTVTVDASTVFDAALAGGIAALARGQIVEVHAQYDVLAYRYQATRIQPGAGAMHFKLRGTVTALDSQHHRLRLGNQLIDYASVSTTDLPPGLAVGSYLRADFKTVRTGTAWAATALRSADLQIADRDDATLDSCVTTYESATRFSLYGLPVDASAASFPDGMAGVQLGARLRVDGSVKNGVLQARIVRSERGTQRFELHGAIASADASTRRFVLRGITVRWTDATRFDDGTASDLKAGAAVEVNGRLSGDGTALEADAIGFGG